MATQVRDLTDAKCASKGRARKASPMEAQDLITRRCGECMSCRGALRRRGAWRGAATTSALGSRWQRAPSAGRRRPRSRQGGGKRHGREMRERRVKGRGPKKPRLRRREQKKGRGVLRFWVVLLYRVFRVHVSENSCANPDSSHLAVDLFTDARDETRVALTALSYLFSFVCGYLFVR